MKRREWDTVLKSMARNKICLKIKSTKYVNRKDINRLDLKGIKRKYITHFFIIIDKIRSKENRKYIREHLEKKVIPVVKKYQGTIDIIYQKKEDSFRFRDVLQMTKVISSEIVDERSIFKRIKLLNKSGERFNGMFFYTYSDFIPEKEDAISFPNNFKWLIVDENLYNFDVTTYSHMDIFHLKD